MLFAQYALRRLSRGFRKSNQLTQVVESNYNRRVLRYAYDAMAQGEFHRPSPA